MTKILATGATVIAVALGGGVAANAAPSSVKSSLCSGSTIVYKNSTTGSAFTQASGVNSSVTGGGGVTLQISTSTTFTVSGSITATADVSASVAIATVKQGYGVTIGASKSGTTSTSGSWKVPSTYKVGRLQIGAMKYTGSVTKYVENKACVLAQVGKAATYNAPKQEWHFQTSKVS